MNALVKEWIQKAEGDFNSALREYRARKLPNYDAAVFMPSNLSKNISKPYFNSTTFPFKKLTTCWR